MRPRLNITSTAALVHAPARVLVSRQIVAWALPIIIIIRRSFSVIFLVLSFYRIEVVVQLSRVALPLSVSFAHEQMRE